MHRILLDENVPAALRHLIGGHEVRPAYEMGWSGLANGELIAAAEADGFAILITADRNIRYQQNLTNRRIALGGADDQYLANHQSQPRADPGCDRYRSARRLRRHARSAHSSTTVLSNVIVALRCKPAFRRPPRRVDDSPTAAPTPRNTTPGPTPAPAPPAIPIPAARYWCPPPARRICNRRSAGSTPLVRNRNRW